MLITHEGDLKLADFGTAFDIGKLTRTVEQTIGWALSTKFPVHKESRPMCGTPAYIPPEIIRREKHTTASDIFSFGAAAGRRVAVRSEMCVTA